MYSGYYNIWVHYTYILHIILPLQNLGLNKTKLKYTTTKCTLESK